MFLLVVCKAAPPIAKKSLITQRNCTLTSVELQNEETKKIDRTIKEAIVWGIIIFLVLLISAFLFCPFCCFCVNDHCHGSSRGYLSI